MTRTRPIDRPIFSIEVLVIAIPVVAAGVLVSQGLVAGIRSVLFR